MRAMADPTAPSACPHVAGPIITAQERTKKTVRAITVLASALLLALGSTAALAGKSKSFEVDFDKCFDRLGDAPYLFTFRDPVSGIEARVVEIAENIEPQQTYISADYVVPGTAETGNLPFTARVGGRVDDRTGLAVLRGYVTNAVGTPAWLVGAGVHDEFENYLRADGTACSRGTLYITPRWKQSHNEKD
jgi:hypothetical protein